MNPKTTLLQASTRLLNYRVVFIGENENIRREAFTQFTQNGLGAIFDADATEAALKTTHPDESVVLFEAKDPNYVAELVKTAIENKFRPQQLILLTDSSSVTLHIIAKTTGCRLSTYSIERKSTGPIVKISDLVANSEKCVDDVLFPILDSELESVRQNGMLTLIEQVSRTPQAAIIDRAMVAYQLSSILMLKPSEVRKCVRLSLYYDLATSKTFASSSATFLKVSRNLWSISDAFEALVKYGGDSIPAENASVAVRVSFFSQKIDEFAQAHTSGQFDNHASWCKVPFEDRVSLKKAVKQVAEARASQNKTSGARSA